LALTVVHSNERHIVHVSSYLNIETGV